MAHYLNVDAASFYLWPNFGRNFVEQFPMTKGNNTGTRPREYVFFGFWEVKRATDCSFSWKTIENHFLSDSSIELHSDLKRVYKYDAQRFHSDVGGLIIMPHAPHTAKWMEFYSTGLTLFIPSHTFLEQLHEECNVVAHAPMHGGHCRALGADLFAQNTPFSPCCGTDPSSPKDQKHWLRLSDFYQLNMMNHVIYFESEQNLIAEMERVHRMSSEQRRNMKKAQITEFTQMAHRFEPQFVSAIYKAHQKSGTDCNAKGNDLLQCLVNQTVAK